MSPNQLCLGWVTHSGCPQLSRITFSVAESSCARMFPEIKFGALRKVFVEFLLLIWTCVGLHWIRARRRAIVTSHGGSENLCLLRWQNLETRCARSFGGSIHYNIIMFLAFAREPYVFVPNVIYHYEMPLPSSGVAKYCDFWHLECYNSETVQDRR